MKQRKIVNKETIPESFLAKILGPNNPAQDKFLAIYRKLRDQAEIADTPYLAFVKGQLTQIHRLRGLIDPEHKTPALDLVREIMSAAYKAKDLPKMGLFGMEMADPIRKALNYQGIARQVFKSYQLGDPQALEDEFLSLTNLIKSTRENVPPVYATDQTTIYFGTAIPQGDHSQKPEIGQHWELREADYIVTNVDSSDLHRMGHDSETHYVDLERVGTWPDYGLGSGSYLERINYARENLIEFVKTNPDFADRAIEHLDPKRDEEFKDWVEAII